MKTPILLALAALLAAGANAQTKQWSQGDPTGDEQYALEVLNRVRADPSSARALYLSQAAIHPAVAGVIAAYHPSATYSPDWTQYLNGKAGMRTVPPKGPLAMYPLFSQQADAAQTMALAGAWTGTAGHGYMYPGDTALLATPSGTNPPGLVKVNPTSVVTGTEQVAEAVAVSGPNATGGTASLKASTTTAGSSASWLRGELVALVNLYDKNVDLRAQFLSGGWGWDMSLFDDRFTISNSGSGAATFGHANLVGIKINAAQSGGRLLSIYSTDNEAFNVTDLPYGTDTLFVTGVVYADSDKDGDYTAGEGVANVKVTLASGGTTYDWYAVTGTAGGYAIPVRRGSGTYTVTFAGTTASGLPANGSSIVTVANDSVKADLIVQSIAKPAQIAVPASDGDNQLINLSTRGVAESGETSLIAGFVIGGNAPKTLLIRGVSKSLTRFGLTGVLQMPELTLFDSKSTPLATAHTKDTYATDPAGTVIVKPDLAAAMRAVGAFDLDTTGMYGDAYHGVYGVNNPYNAQGDCAIVVTLQPGLYTASIAADPATAAHSAGSLADAQLRAGGYTVNQNAWGDSGIVLLEIYDLSPSSGHLVNLSSRGKIETGARQMIVGFVVSGSGHRQLLVRGIGPTLKSLGVTTALDDTVATLFDGNSKPLLANDDWGIATWTDQARTAMASAGAFGLTDSARDAVILTTVTPGLYSAGITSATGQTGVALAEVYER